MERFEKRELKNEYKHMEMAANIARFVLFPVFLVLRIFYWVWDYDYSREFKRRSKS